MSERVNDLLLFHVTRTGLPYSQHPPLLSGSRVTCGGTAHNPFFGYYETPRTIPVTHADGIIEEVPALLFLRRVRDGEATISNLPSAAFQIAEHFQLLSRELIMELIRREEAPDAPSRRSALWASETLADADDWAHRLGNGASIVQLRATGTIFRADASLLVGDAEAYSSIEDKARRYWRGETSANPEPEILFSGTAIVQ